MFPGISDELCKCLIVKSGRVAQLVEQCPFKAWVAGSNPAALTMIPKVQPGHMGYTMYRLHG